MGGLCLVDLICLVRFRQKKQPKKNPTLVRERSSCLNFTPLLSFLLMYKAARLHGHLSLNVLFLDIWSCLFLLEEQSVCHQQVCSGVIKWQSLTSLRGLTAVAQWGPSGDEWPGPSLD